MKAPPTEATDAMPMRVARALSVMGYCSRREADRLVAAGRVRINGKLVENPAEFVDPSSDRIAVDDRPLGARSAPTYIALHKPTGVVCTVRDPHASAAVVDLVPSDVRLYPVGRLDKDSEGLILLTNDGDFAQAVAHPRSRTEKEYLVQLPALPTESQLQQLRGGAELDGRPVIPTAVEVYRGPIPWATTRVRGAGPWLRIVLQEGRNREIRRMLEMIEFQAKRLIRVRIGPLRLGRLQPSQWRHLRTAEVDSLMRSARRPRRPGPQLEADAEVWPVVAIDGPAAAGKTVVGTAVARLIGATFLDTGLLYRAVALEALELGIEPRDGPALTAIARDLDLRVQSTTTDGKLVTTMHLRDRDVTTELRSPPVDACVSEVASHAEVRAALIPAQRRAAGLGRAVVVGRDIGTTIFPDAVLKVYLDASLEERARRRAAETGGDVSSGRTAEALAHRDALDSTRAVAPLQVAPDAVVIETDRMTVEQVVRQVRSLALQRLNANAR